MCWKSERLIYFFGSHIFRFKFQEVTVGVSKSVISDFYQNYPINRYI